MPAPRLPRRSRWVAAAAGLAIAGTLAGLPSSGAAWTWGTTRSGSWQARATFSSATPAVEASFVRVHGATSDQVSNTTGLVVSLLAPVPAGRTLLVWVGVDNVGYTGPAVLGIARPGAETATWQEVGFVNSCSGSTALAARGVLLGVRTTVPWPAGSYPVTLDTAVAAKTAVAGEFANVGLAPRPSTATPTSQCTKGQVARHDGAQAGDVVLLGIVTEKTPAAVAPAGGWTSIGSVFTSNGGVIQTNIAGRLEFAIQPVSGQSWSHTTDAAYDGGAALVALPPG